MKIFPLIFRRLQWINLPGAILMMLLQRTPVLNVAAAVDEMVIASPVGIILKSALATLAALGTVNSLAGASALNVSAGTSTGITVPAGTAMSVSFSLPGSDSTADPTAKWTLGIATGSSFPPGLNFSTLTAPGTVNQKFPQLSGTPTTAGTYNITLQAFSSDNFFSSPVYPYAITVTSSGNTAPAFTTQPANQTVAPGASVTFSSVASGSPAPTFQWQKDGILIGGATSSSFMIPSVIAADAGNYSVIATNSAGSVTSNIAALTVSAATSAPAFTTQPASQTVAPGASVTFSSVASGSPSPTFQWQKGGVNIGGATSGSFMIPSVAAGDAGNYSVIATNSAGSVTSNIAALTVSAATSAPAFTTQPASQTVAPGASVTFSSVASGSPSPTFQWQKGGVNIGGATSGSFMIPSVAAGDAGNYSVVATNSAGSATSNIAILTVSAAASAPVFTTQPASQTVATGASVTFTVAANGSPAPTFQWQKSGVDIGGATSSSFMIASVTVADTGNYTVTATNSAGSAVSNVAVLTIGSTAGNQVTSETVTTGHNVTFSAGNTAGSIQWQISTNGGVTWSNLSNDSTYGGATSATLSITNAGASLNNAMYRYTATSSGMVATSNAATLTVAQAFFPFPTSIAVDGSGTLYVSDSNTDTIQKISSAGQITLVAGTSGTAGSVDGMGAVARFNQPSGLTLTSSGVLYVTDTANATIRHIGTDGAVTTLAGSATNRGNMDGTGTAAMFSQPIGIAMDSTGTLYVADSMNDTVRKVTGTGVVTTFAGTAGVTGSADGLGTAARFNLPTGIALDVNGTVYVSDTTNNTIRTISPAGMVTTLAGVAGVSGFTDGTGAAALFNHPSALAVDATGNIYLVDTGNSVIRKITASGVVTTLAGLPGIAGLEDGNGGNAFFNQPQGLVVDSAGNVYVADTGNAAIRKITPGGTVTTLMLSAATPAPAPAPMPSPGPMPNPMPQPSSGGGGGLIEGWFAGLIGLLFLLRRRSRHE